MLITTPAIVYHGGHGYLKKEGDWGSRTHRASTTLALFPRPVALSQQAVNSGGLTQRA